MDAAHVILLKICGQKQGEPEKLSPVGASVGGNQIGHHTVRTECGIR